MLTKLTDRFIRGATKWLDEAEVEPTSAKVTLEWLVAQALELHFPRGASVLHDLKTDNQQQVDLLVVSRSGLYVIEVVEVTTPLYGYTRNAQWYKIVENRRFQYPSPLVEVLLATTAIKFTAKVNAVTPLVYFVTSGKGKVFMDDTELTEARKLDLTDRNGSMHTVQAVTSFGELVKHIEGASPRYNLQWVTNTTYTLRELEERDHATTY